jgi:hypothetical protein
MPVVEKVKPAKKPTITLTLSEEVYAYIRGAAADDRRTPAMWATIYLEDGVTGLIEDINPDKQGA